MEETGWPCMAILRSCSDCSDCSDLAHFSVKKDQHLDHLDTVPSFLLVVSLQKSALSLGIRLMMRSIAKYSTKNRQSNFKAMPGELVSGLPTCTMLCCNGRKGATHGDVSLITIYIYVYIYICITDYHNISQPFGTHSCCHHFYSLYHFVNVEQPFLAFVCSIFSISAWIIPSDA